MDVFYSTVGFFATGGPFMYPILIVFAVGAAIAIERYVTLSIVKTRNQSVWSRVQPALVNGDFEQAREAEDHTDEAPFGLGEELPENTDKGELDEDLDPDIQGLPLDGARKGAVLALAHLATLTARVSRMTVTLTWPG